MSYQQERKPGNGRVWAQTKSQNPRAPQFTGELKTPDGQVWRISMWNAFDRNTNQFNGFSMKAQAPQQQQNPTQPQQGYVPPQQGYQPQGGPNRDIRSNKSQDWQAPPDGPPAAPPAQSEDDYGGGPEY